MTEFEMTKLCAEAMGFPDVHAYPVDEKYPDFRVSFASADGRERFRYDPLHNDAQAMALVKRFEMNISGPYHRNPETWRVVIADEICSFSAMNADLNRAIVECVAKMEASVNDSH